MKKHSGLSALLGVCLAVATLTASADDKRFYVSPMFTYTLVDKDRGTKDGIGGTVAVGKRMTYGLNLELAGFWSQMKDKGISQTTKFSGIGAAALISPLQTWPDAYLKLAVYQGQATDHPDNAGTTGFSYRTTVFDPGLGYLLALGPWIHGYDISLRTEIIYRYDAHDRKVAGTTGGKSDFYDYVANVGLYIPLGKLPVPEAPAAVAVEQPAAPPSADVDNDGIPDDKDQCPSTPAGSKVDEKGCPLAADADGDGIPDDQDKCPSTAAGTKVDANGCPEGDADGDGIPDANDKCPATPAGANVDADGCSAEQAAALKPAPSGCRAPLPGEPISLEGCATGEAIVMRGVTFDSGSARLTANAKVILNQVADALKARPELKVEIGGHTDNKGSKAINKKLSEKRANAVMDYLVKRGVAADQMSAKGYGAGQPIDTNKTDEGRENNRRVELKVLAGGSAAAPAPAEQPTPPPPAEQPPGPPPAEQPAPPPQQQ
jgi:OOP family OmpA-OmpF porin